MSSGGVLFGRDAWDPVTIIAQIVAVQCLYYLSLGLLFKLIVAPYVPALSLYHFFDWRWVSFSSFRGWMVSVATFTNALLAAVYLRLIVSGGSLVSMVMWLAWLSLTLVHSLRGVPVQRAKKCLDFAGTLMLLHLIAVTCFSGFPKRLPWWALHGTNVAVTALLGEWLCMQKEMQDIPLASLRRNRANAGAAATLGGLAGAAARVTGGGGGGGSSGPGSGSSNGTLGGSRLSNVRTSTANIMELGRVSHAGTQQQLLQEQAALITPKGWAPISPLE